MRCALLVFIAFAVLAGCSGGGSAGPGPTPTPTPCAPGSKVDMQAALVSPPQGATGVSPATSTITVNYSDSRVLQPVVLRPSDGSQSLVAVDNGQVPPSTGPATLQISGTLRSGVTYSVTGDNTNFAHDPCFVHVTGNFGSFTTR